MSFTLILWLVFIFTLGACIGSFLNVCIHRLPFEKSLVWPGSRCGHCLQAIRWYDNIPLVSYWRLGGRCRTCGEKFSVQYFLVELLTAACFVGLFWLDVVEDVHHVDPSLLGSVRPEHARLVIFGVHAVLLSFLLVATVCDLEQQAIPLSLTMTGTVVGLVVAVLFPWPWPYDPAKVSVAAGGPGGLFMNEARFLFRSRVPEGALYPWPFWYPLPEWLRPGGNWQTGLITGLAGALAGTLMLRAVRFLFGIGMGAEYMEPEEPEFGQKPAGPVGRWLSWVQRVGGKALGLGDADLMMMAGSFLGWQPVVVAFFVGVFPGLVFGIIQMTRSGSRELPFGPALALGVMITAVGWPWIGPRFEFFFFDLTVLVALTGFCCVLMFIAAYFLRVIRLMRQ